MSRVTMIVAIVLIALILLIFVAGLLLAVATDVTQTAPRVQMVRDVFIIILAFQSILIVGALAVLIVQIARLINLLQNEVMPILQNTQETITTARTTVEFVGNNLTEPVMRLNGFLAALSVLLREVFGIRRALRRGETNNGAQD
ncbi:MAG: hypothetical protein CL610_06215 [Anaerolineaceae bacterium]|nr:hypothetical protein [Anaerolineaceae bacterium]